jgi:serine/threonine-protein kinase Chk1
MLTIDPAKRMTLNDVHAHTWVMRQVFFNSSHLLPSLPLHRPSQLASRGVVELAEKLTESLRQTGDLELANPVLKG